ncbi:MAG: dihydroorotase [Bacteroidales bacterium]|nr:dihydroorotase [Bacteroidales bacterium]
MSKSFLIQGAEIVNEGKRFFADIVVSQGKIEKILNPGDETNSAKYRLFERVDATGKVIIPGVIDDQVHFREPGFTHKGDIYSESRAAAAGGITSFMEMPNTVPHTLTQDLLEEKYNLASQKSLVNYSFYLGASNDNLSEVIKTDPKLVCGIKVFMGSSTGNMLVDNQKTLQGIFSESPCLVAVHCEDEPTIQKNFIDYRALYKEDTPASVHPLIRSAEACYLSSAQAVSLAEKFNTRLHILHLSTAMEMSLFRNDIPLKDKRITAEVCLHHLWFSDADYATKGNFIKWNPAIKSDADRAMLWTALLDGRIDVIATDHAPHSYEEKLRPYFHAPSGGPLVQHLLPAMIEFYHQGKVSLEFLVQKMCHNPAIAFQVQNRGFIREGYAADLVVLDLNKAELVEKSNIYYKVGWSPFEGEMFKTSVCQTYVNGNLVFDTGKFNETTRGERLIFDR